MESNATPVVDWPALDVLFASAEEGMARLRDSLGGLTVDDLARIAAETGTEPATVSLAASLTVDLAGVLLDMTRALRRAAPALARSLGQNPEQEYATCPRCGEPVPICEVGTVACHRECGYCSHPAMNGDFCALCDAERGTFLWLDRQRLKPGSGGRILMAKILEERTEALCDEFLARGGSSEPPAGG
jgi:hypothetical protein